MELMPLRKKTTCPVCDTVLGCHAVDAPGLISPEGGAPCVCAHCRSFLVFQDDLSLKEMTTEEIVALNPTVRRQMIEYREQLRETPAEKMVEESQHPLIAAIDDFIKHQVVIPFKDKDPKLKIILDKISLDRFGRTASEAINKHQCVMCGNPATHFKTEQNAHRYDCSVVCQTCQDNIDGK